MKLFGLYIHTGCKRNIKIVLGKLNFILWRSKQIKELYTYNSQTSTTLWTEKSHVKPFVLLQYHQTSSSYLFKHIFAWAWNPAMSSGSPAWMETTSAHIKGEQTAAKPHSLAVSEQSTVLDLWAGLVLQWKRWKNSMQVKLHLQWLVFTPQIFRILNSLSKF